MIKKPTYYTHKKNEGPQRVIMGVLYAFLCVIGVSAMFLPKIAYSVSARDYYDVVSFSGDIPDNSAVLTINVKTTFSIPYKKSGGQYFCFSFKNYAENANTFSIRQSGSDFNSVIDPFSIKENGILKYTDTWTCPANLSFVAGHTYEFKLTQNRDNSGRLGVWYHSYYETISKGWFYLDISDYIYNLFNNYPASFLTDPAQYPYVPIPTINITFPHQNDEISEAFYIQGVYDAQDLNTYSELHIWLQYQNKDIYPFVKTLATTTGDIYERISGLPAGDYQISFVFSGEQHSFYISDKIPIKVVETIPFELPETQEQSPTFFGVINGSDFYPDHSNYSTPTDLYSHLINAIQPILIVIGDNLTFFSSRFDQAMAKETGEKLGEAVLLSRAYSSNLNTFFNNFPVSDFLAFYLVLLVAVIVFRIAKNLINTIKP